MANELITLHWTYDFVLFVIHRLFRLEQIGEMYGAGYHDGIVEEYPWKTVHALEIIVRFSGGEKYYLNLKIIYNRLTKFHDSRFCKKIIVIIITIHIVLSYHNVTYYYMKKLF